jgi:hypothetical protein
VLGKGFVVTTEQAQALIAKDPHNKDVLFPYLNGEDLNNDPEQKPSRWVINFFDWSEEKARTYPDCFEIVERLVKPEREKLDETKSSTNKNRKKNWWKYGSDAKSLYETISKVDQVMVVARISKTLAMCFIEKNIVFADALVVFNNDSITKFSIMQSSIHNIWAWRYCTTMKTDLNYTPGNVFETFAFPKFLTKEREGKLKSIGIQYYELRKKIMSDFGFGLTKLYNLFHNSQLKSIDEEDHNLDIKTFEKKYGKEAILLKRHLQKINKILFYNELIDNIYNLRIFHKILDEAVANAYEWNDVLLKHDFYELDYLPENDRIRFTIHPNARREILTRLLHLNHQIYEEEKSSISKPTKANKKSNSGTLFELF